MCLIEHNRIRLARINGDVFGSSVVVLDIVRHVARLEDKVTGAATHYTVCGTVRPLNVVVAVHKGLAFNIDIHPMMTFRTDGNLRNFASLVAKEKRHS